MKAFPCGSAGKESACNVEDLGSIPGLGRSPGEGKGYRLQYSGLENSMDCIVHGVANSQTRLERFSLHYSMYSLHLLPLSPGIRSSSCPLSQWCYLTISPLYYCLSNPSSVNNQFHDVEYFKSLKHSGGWDLNESACNAGDPGSIPGSERSPGEENGYPLQYPCLENSMDRGALLYHPLGRKESDMTEWLTLSNKPIWALFSLFVNLEIIMLIS